jgi:hypothetical protein
MRPEELLPWFAWLAPRVLLLFGLGFLAANLRLGALFWAYRRRSRTALLVWEGQKPRYYGFSLALGVVLGLLLVVEIVLLRRPADTVFGEAMMFVYYGYTFPLSTRIRRGFYGDGIWADAGFIRWSEVSAVSWKEEPRLTLIVISHERGVARHLEIPGPLYGQARRLLRDRIKAHDIQIGGAGLDLGSREGEDTV